MPASLFPRKTSCPFSLISPCLPPSSLLFFFISLWCFTIRHKEGSPSSSVPTRKRPHGLELALLMPTAFPLGVNWARAVGSWGRLDLATRHPCRPSRYRLQHGGLEARVHLAHLPLSRWGALQLVCVVSSHLFLPLPYSSPSCQWRRPGWVWQAGGSLPTKALGPFSCWD